MQTRSLPEEILTPSPTPTPFFAVIQERFGWTGPPDNKRSEYDYLPLIIQADPNEKPELFEVPVEAAPPVFIHHPSHPQLSELMMRWYPIPGKQSKQTE